MIRGAVSLFRYCTIFPCAARSPARFRDVRRLYAVRWRKEEETSYQQRRTKRRATSFELPSAIVPPNDLRDIRVLLLFWCKIKLIFLCFQIIYFFFFYTHNWCFQFFFRWQIKSHGPPFLRSSRTLFSYGFFTEGRGDKQ